MEVAVDLSKPLLGMQQSHEPPLPVNEVLVMSLGSDQPGLHQDAILKTHDLGFTRQNLSLVVNKLIKMGRWVRLLPMRAG